MISIKSNDRIFVCGKTGSGKSYFIKNEFLPRIERFIFYDPKHQHDDINGVLVTNPADLQNAINEGHRAIVYRPFLVNDDEWNEICRIIYLTGNIWLIADEISYHVDSNKMTAWHKVLMTTGRTRGIGVLNCSQKPQHTVHNIILSETEHYFCFFLLLEGDRAKLAAIHPDFYNAHLLPEYHFFYFSVRDRDVIFHKPV